MLTRYSIYVPIEGPTLPLSLSLSRSRHPLASLLRASGLKRRYAGEPPRISRSRHEYVCRGMNVHKGEPRVLAALRIHEFIISPRDIVAGNESVLRAAVRGHQRDPCWIDLCHRQFSHTG